MIKLYCDLCDKEIINQDYVEQTIFNHFDFDSSVDAHICKKCWEKQSPTSQTSPKGTSLNSCVKLNSQVLLQARQSD